MIKGYLVVKELVDVPWNIILTYIHEEQYMLTRLKGFVKQAH